MAPDLEDLLVGILRVDKGAARRAVEAEIDVAAIRREGRLAELFLVPRIRFLDDRDTAPAVAVINPDLARAQRALRRKVFARRYVAAIRRPVRVVEQPEILFCELPWLGPVRIHDPDVVAAAGIGGERDLGAVWRVARLPRPCQAAVDPRRLAAGDGQRVDVTEQVERDRRSVRADIKAHPSAGRRIDRDFARLSRGRFNVPRCLFGFCRHRCRSKNRKS